MTESTATATPAEETKDHTVDFNCRFCGNDTYTEVADLGNGKAFNACDDCGNVFMDPKRFSADDPEETLRRVVNDTKAGGRRIMRYLGEKLTELGAEPDSKPDGGPTS